MRLWFVAAFAASALWCAGCGEDEEKTDAGTDPKDTGTVVVDSGTPDAGSPVDSGGIDATITDTGPAFVCNPGTEGCPVRTGAPACDAGLLGLNFGTSGSVCYRPCTQDSECSGSTRMNARCGHVGAYATQANPDTPIEVLACVDSIGETGATCDIFSDSQGHYLGCDPDGFACNLNTKKCLAVARPNCNWTIEDPRGACPSDKPFCNPVFASTATVTSAEGVCTDRSRLPGDLCVPADPAQQCDATAVGTACLPLDQAGTIGFCMEECSAAGNWECTSTPGSFGTETSCARLPDFQVANGNLVACTSNAQCNASAGKTCIDFLGQKFCAGTPTYGFCSSNCSVFPDSCLDADRGCADMGASVSALFSGVLLCAHRDGPTAAVANVTSNGQGGIELPAQYDDCASGNFGSCADPAFCAVEGTPGQQRGFCLVGCSTSTNAAFRAQFPQGGCEARAGTTCQSVASVTTGNEGVCL